MSKIFDLRFKPLLGVCICQHKVAHQGAPWNLKTQLFSKTYGIGKRLRIILFFFVFAGSVLVTPWAIADNADEHWAVIGIIEGKTFTIDCRFKKVDEELSGACIDGPTGDATVQGGRSHLLLRGRASGETMSWTYQSSYLFLKFDVVYVGVLRGDHVSGSVTAAGKVGTFTADRVQS